MNTVEHYLLGLEGQQKKIMTYLHYQLVQEYDLMAKIRFNIPMYYQSKWVCYLNPLKSDGVELVFMKGYQLSNEQDILDRKGRKQVAGISLYDARCIPMSKIHEIIHEALILDQLST